MSISEQKREPKMIEMFGGPFDGELVECDEIVGVEPLACKPEHGELIHLYQIETRIVENNPGRSRRRRGYFYVGSEREEVLEKISKRARKGKQKEGGRGRARDRE